MPHYFPSYTFKPILAIVAAAALLLAACGGKQSMASKSDAAYREAQRKATPVESESHGDAHAGAAATHSSAGPHENHLQPDTTTETTAVPEHGPGGATTGDGSEKLREGHGQ
jgi:ABC-type glycerol-3-phosphate transport system substrate-binding protein